MKRKAQLVAQSLDAISDPVNVGEACLPRLRKVLKQPALGFDRVNRARNITHLTLTGANQRYGFARERHPIHLLGGAEELYWVGVTLDFQYENPAFRLTSAGILVFRGLANSFPTPFIRAEWHCSKSDLSAPHAQPHWHVYSPEPAEPEGFYNDIQAVQTFSDDQYNRSDVETVPFHFAMCADWQHGSSARHIALMEKSAELSDWLGGCIEYIEGQVA